MTFDPRDGDPLHVAEDDEVELLHREIIDRWLAREPFRWPEPKPRRRDLSPAVLFFWGVVWLCIGLVIGAVGFARWGG